MTSISDSCLHKIPDFFRDVWPNIYILHSSPRIFEQRLNGGKGWIDRRNVSFKDCRINFFEFVGLQDQQLTFTLRRFNRKDFIESGSTFHSILRSMLFDDFFLVFKQVFTFCSFIRRKPLLSLDTSSQPVPIVNNELVCTWIFNSSSPKKIETKNQDVRHHLAHKSACMAHHKRSISSQETISPFAIGDCETVAPRRPITSFPAQKSCGGKQSTTKRVDSWLLLGNFGFSLLTYRTIFALWKK